QTLRVDELTERQEEELARKYDLVCAAEAGRSVRDAMIAARLVCSLRSARNYVRAYREKGYQGLVDGRTGSRPRSRSVIIAEAEGWTPVPVWLTLALDEYSRSVAGFVVSSVCPDAATIADLLAHAILRKSNPKWINWGVPDEIQIDRGRDFMSAAIKTSCAS